jgi:hypothetical protein
MAKATSRKHATHRKARANHAAKPHARRIMKAAPTRVSNPPEIVPEPEMVGEDVTERIEPRAAEENQEDELGIYGPDRGEDAGG